MDKKQLAYARPTICYVDFVLVVRKSNVLIVVNSADPAGFAAV